MQSDQGSEYSALSELDDDSESDVPLSKSKPKAKGKSKGVGASGYRIRDALKPCRTTTYTAKALYDQIHSGEVELNPEYQRGVVWPEAKQIGIIDSIFRNFYIPPIIFATQTQEDGTETKICIDGKQRLTSIQKFMDGLIPHRDSITNEKLWFRDISAGKGPRRKILPNRYLSLFSNKQITCVEYHDLTDNNEREIFQRVQLGMALTPAEKLQVTNSPRATLIREILAKYLTEDGLAGSLDWDRSRGSDFRCLAQAIFAVEKYPYQATISSLPQLEKWLQESVDPDQEFKDKVDDIYCIFVYLAQEKKYYGPFKKPARVSPIEFISISLLIAAHKSTFSYAQLSSAIGLMRGDVRKHHVDIRSNSRVSKTMLDFIKGLRAATVNGAGDPAGLDAALKRRKEEAVKPMEIQPTKTEEISPPFSFQSPTASQFPSVPSQWTQSQSLDQSHSQPSLSSHLNGKRAPNADRLASIRAAKAEVSATSPAQTTIVNSQNGQYRHTNGNNSLVPRLIPTPSTPLLENSLMQRMAPTAPRAMSPRFPNSPVAPPLPYGRPSVNDDPRHSPGPTYEQHSHNRMDPRNEGDRSETRGSHEYRRPSGRSNDDRDRDYRFHPYDRRDERDREHRDEREQGRDYDRSRQPPPPPPPLSSGSHRSNNGGWGNRGGKSI